LESDTLVDIRLGTKDGIFSQIRAFDEAAQLATNGRSA
jgi:hypothetical protein